MEIFKLFGSILIDSNEAEESIQKTESKAVKLVSALGSGIKTAAKWGASLVAGATAVAGAMVASAKGTAEALDVVDKASIRMGISAESYQELAYAAGLYGVEMSTLEEAAKKLSGTDLNLGDAIAQLQAIEDDEARAAAAMEMFGEQAYQLTPLLNAGTEGMEAMRKEANDLGLVMSQESVSSGAAMNDMFSKLEQTFGMVKNTIMVELMPYVMMILEWCIENLPLVAETVQKVMDKLMPIIAPILEAVMSLFKAVFALINGDMETFGEEVVKFFENLATAAVTLGKNILNGVLTGLKSAWSSISNWVSEKVNWLIDKLTFWSDSQAEMRSDGFSHASGLAYVPYDNYPATLHRGETVLNAADTSSLLADVRKLAGSGGSTSSTRIEVVMNLDGQTLARKTFDYNQRENALRGGALVEVYG